MDARLFGDEQVAMMDRIEGAAHDTQSHPRSPNRSAMVCGRDLVRLGRAAAGGGRLKSLAGRGGATLVDDSYNANPASVRAALDYLDVLGGTRILVLGDMAELGPTAESLHREVGEYARGRCDALFVIGPLASEAAAGYGAGARAFTDYDTARVALEPLLAANVTVLVKASRVMGLDRLVRALAADAPPNRKGAA
jgi:UDP-N-acetylmuramoyl-tripeptide--D-alanyl-D-alanine ligase